MNKELLEHLRSIIKGFASYQVRTYVKYLLISLYTALGIPTLLFVVGYLILYGLYFGGSNSSLLDFSISYVPIHPIACLLTGMFVIALTLFVYSIVKIIVKEKNKKRRKDWVLVSVIFFSVFHYILSVVLVTQSEENIHMNALKLLMLWILPITVALTIVFINFIYNHYGNLTFSVVLSIFVLLFIDNYLYELEGYILFSLIIGLSIVLMIYIRYATKTNNQRLLLLAFSVFAGYLSGQIIISTIPQNIRNILLLLLVISITTSIFYFIFKGIRSTFAKEKKDMNLGKEEQIPKMTYSLSHLVLLLTISFLFFAPIIGTILFSLGDYIGTTLKSSQLVSYEEIRVGDNEPIIGKVVATDSLFVFISQKDRTLKTIKLPNNVGVQWEAITKN